MTTVAIHIDTINAGNLDGLARVLKGLLRQAGAVEVQAELDTDEDAARFFDALTIAADACGARVAGEYSHDEEG